MPGKERAQVGADNPWTVTDAIELAALLSGEHEEAGYREKLYRCPFAIHGIWNPLLLGEHATKAGVLLSIVTHTCVVFDVAGSPYHEIFVAHVIPLDMIQGFGLAEIIADSNSGTPSASAVIENVVIKILPINRAKPRKK